jgi:hypothetical protein
MTRAHTPARIIEELETQTHFRLDQARMSGAALRGELGVRAYLIAHELERAPAPLDVADLAATFRRSKVEAAAQLGMLSRPQLVVQAWCYAAYLAELHGCEVDAETVLNNWERGLARHGVEVR